MTKATGKYYHVEPVGSVCIVTNNLSRRIRLRVNPDGVVHVSMPDRVPEKKAIDFVVSKADWIQRQQKKIRTGLTVFGPETCFRTRFHSLKIVRVSQGKVSAMIGAGIIQINIPERYDCNNAEIQQYIRGVIVQVMRHEGKVFLPDRLKKLAGQHGFKFGNVSVKHVKSRWGSCSSVNNINLNLHLMRLPGELTDYVLLHELAHTVEKNHGKGFWALMEKVCPGARKLDKELKNYRVEVF